MRISLLIFSFQLCACYGWRLPFSGRTASSASIQATDFARQRKALSSIMLASLCILQAPQIDAQTGVYVPHSMVASAAEQVQGTTELEGEALRVFRKAKQNVNDGEFIEAQKLYEQVVVADPDFIYGWADLGNVLILRGSLEQGLLCYKKALSLAPPREAIPTLRLNKAAVEMSLGHMETAIKDLSVAEAVGGPTQTVLTNKAVAMSMKGNWQDACDTFEKVISTAERNALPWWLRYSMALLETGRGTEAVGFLQRTLNRFPEETECKAFAAALYTALGSKIEANRYWQQMSEVEREQYSAMDGAMVTEKLHWGPNAVKSFKSFLKYAST